jgi:dihydroorotate dehydrogenase (NAD+) catalytic subunit
MAGASAVQVGTAIFTEPSLLVRLIDELETWMMAQGVTRLGEIVGSANPRFRARIPLEESFADEIAQG